MPAGSVKELDGVAIAFPLSPILANIQKKKHSKLFSFQAESIQNYLVVKLGAD